jgi:hypothetical protein
MYCDPVQDQLGLSFFWGGGGVGVRTQKFVFTKL